MQAIPFLPEHIEVLTRSPNIRRTSLDTLFTQFDREYLSSKREYDKVARQRNRLLENIKETRSGYETLPFWDEQLVTHGKVLQEKRRHFATFLQDYLTQHVSDIDPRGGTLAVQYDLNEISPERLAEMQSTEIAAKRCLVGPHRDDLSFLLNERDVARFGSRGEQRSVMLLWKLAELAYLEQETGRRPILLLDDIFSEFDAPHRREALFAFRQAANDHYHR